MNTKTILLVIAVLLAAIAGFVAYESSRPKTTGEQISEAVEEVGDEVGDAVDNATR